MIILIIDKILSTFYINIFIYEKVYDVCVVKKTW